MTEVKESEIIECESQKKWEQWLSKNHNIQMGVWIRFYKKASLIPTVTYAQALDEALCYGWIDGQVRKLRRHIISSEIYTTT